jgi:hypothetical protein
MCLVVYWRTGEAGDIVRGYTPPLHPTTSVGEEEEPQRLGQGYGRGLGVPQSDNENLWAHSGL